MSRIGKKPVPVPAGVKVEVAGRTVKTSGPKGHLAWECPLGVTVEFDSKAAEIRVGREQDTAQGRALHGLTRALIANMVFGVQSGYRKALEIYGTGYGCKLQGRKLLLNCGYMGRGVDGQGKPKDAQFALDIPAGLEVTVEVPAARGDNEPAKLSIEGPDKQVVGQFAAEVRKIRPPEPYKGKGIRYVGEHVRRKQGKAFAGSGG